MSFRSDIVTLLSLLTASAALPAAAAPSLAHLPAAAVELGVSPALLSQGQEQLTLALPDGRSIAFRTTVENPEPGLVGVRGRSAGSDRLSLFLADNEILGGDVYASGGRYRLIEHAGRYWWVPHADFPGELLFASALPDTAKPTLAPPTPAGPAPVALPDAKGVQRVDVLALYTPLYRARYGSAKRTRNEAQRLTFLANAYFANSGVPVQYRLAGAEEYRGTSEDADFFENYDAMAADPGVAKLRNRAGADLVVLLRTMDGDANLCGLGSLFNGGAQTDPPDDVNAERDAYNVVGAGPDESGYRCADFVYAHELGHSMGGGHNFLAHGLPFLYWKSYAHGWDCGEAGVRLSYASIMSYGNSGTGLEARGDFFSSPAVILDGMPCGSEGISSTEVTEADNAQSITEAAPYVAAYRSGKSAKSENLLGSGALGLLTLFPLFAAVALGRLRLRQ